MTVLVILFNDLFPSWQIRELKGILGKREINFSQVGKKVLLTFE